jgi:hypothetical protein
MAHLNGGEAAVTALTPSTTKSKLPVRPNLSPGL